MKKIAFVSMSALAGLLIGCAYQQGGGAYYDYDYNNNDHYTTYHNPYGTPTPMSTIQQNYSYSSKPRPYSVTPTDQGKFDTLNSEIEARKQAIKSNKGAEGTAKNNPAEAVGNNSGF